jgi:hypothetical protein
VTQHQSLEEFYLTFALEKDVITSLKELDLGEFIPELEQFMIEHKKYEQTKKDEKEKDRIKKLHSEATSQTPGNKKGIRGADGKYAYAPLEDDKNDTDDEDDMKEEPLAFQIVDAISAKHGIHGEECGDENAAKRRKLDHDEESSGWWFIIADIAFGITNKNTYLHLTSQLRRRWLECWTILVRSHSNFYGTDTLTKGDIDSFFKGARLGANDELVFSFKLVSDDPVLSICGDSRKLGADGRDLLWTGPIVGFGDVAMDGVNVSFKISWGEGVVDAVWVGESDTFAKWMVGLFVGDSLPSWVLVCVEFE